MKALTFQQKHEYLQTLTSSKLNKNIATYYVSISHIRYTTQRILHYFLVKYSEKHPFYSHQKLHSYPFIQ